MRHMNMPDCADCEYAVQNRIVEGAALLKNLMVAFDILISGAPEAGRSLSAYE